MLRVPKPILWWSSEDDENGLLSAVLTNKRVWLNGLNVRQHTPFQIRRRNLLTRIPWLGRRLFRGWVTDVPTLYQDGAMRSATYWHATIVAHNPSTEDYFFVDGNEGVSGLLTVSNTPTSRFRSVKHGGGGLNPRIEAGLSFNGLATAYGRAELANYGKDFEFTFETDVLAPTDPNVEIEVLEPGTSRDLLLETARDVLDHELGDLQTTTYNPYLASALRHVDSFLGRRYVDFVVGSETRFIATPDDPYPVSVTVRGDGPVRLLFAIQVRDLDTGTTSISEFMPVVVTQSRQF